MQNFSRDEAGLVLTNTAWHSLPIEEVLKRLRSTSFGLSQKEAFLRLKIFGSNKIETKKKDSIWFLLLREAKSPIILVLLLALIFSLALGHLIDTLVILAVLFLDFAINFIEAYKSDRALSELKKISAEKAVVVRDGERKTVLAEELVPGDIVILNAGDRVPADLRVTKAEFLEVDESLLTGEAYPVRKKWQVVPENVSEAERANILYSGSVVSAGSGEGVVIATGRDAFFGQLSYNLSGMVEEVTPLERQIAGFSKDLVLFLLGAMLFLIMIALYRGIPFKDALIFTMALSVSAIPEGLPAVTSIALAVGARRMAKEKAIIRRLASVETLGQVTRLVFDKTGTLTENELSIASIYIPWEEVPLNSSFGKLVLRLASEASEDPSLNAKEPLEYAIAKHYISKKKRLDLFPFRSEFALSAGLISDKEKVYMAVKGSPEAILARSTFCFGKDKKRFLSKEMRERLLSEVERVSALGRRVLAVAKKDFRTRRENIDHSDIENLVFVGFIIYYDPSKKEAYKVLRQIEQAGITATMVTGDHRLTAHAIADEVGLRHELVYVGRDLHGNNLKNIVEDSAIFARVTPADKLALTKSWQSKGEIVAVCGDGINDAPALKKADIGIAMGKNGVGVVREAADLVLMDNDLKTFIAAIREGRTIYKNIQKTLVFLLSSNGGELLTMILALFLGLPLPLTPLQILWINLVTDGTADVALVLDLPEKNILKEKPRLKGEAIIPFRYLRRILLTSGTIAFFVLFFEALYYFSGRELSELRSVVFLTMAMMHVWNLFNCRSLRESFINQPLIKGSYVFYSFMGSLILALLTIYLPFFNRLFETTPLPFWETLLLIGISSILLPIVDIAKILEKKREESLTEKALLVSKVY